MPEQKPTPMMQQYLAVKRQHRDKILFFRLGDFYEMFYDDAKTASRELELTLTGKDCGLPERAPMCGIPYHSCEGYIARLIAKGYKVAICEQAEDPKLAKGLVKRKIIRVITPGTVIENTMLDEGRNNYLASVFVQNGESGLCFCDISTGEVRATQLSGDPDRKLTDELGKLTPSEVLWNGAAAALPELKKLLGDRLGATCNLVAETPQADEPALLSRFHARSLAELGLEGRPLAVLALTALLDYLGKTQMTGLERIDTLTPYDEDEAMRLDLFTRQNLELCETLRGKEKRGSLLWVLDRTRTAMGKRMIRAWVEQPLLSCARITRRLNAVQELYDDLLLRGRLSEQLAGVFDLERIMTRIAYGTANARELRSLAQTLEKLPGLLDSLKNVHSDALRRLRGELDPLPDLYGLLNRAIVDDPPVSVREGGLIRPGYNAEVDSLRDAVTHGRGYLADIESRERKRTGIHNLKIGYNRVFGYYIEVSRSNLSQVPSDYIRKQTLTTGERYITEELKKLETRVLGAQERRVQLEYDLFDDVRKKAAAQHGRVQKTARAVAALDVLVSLAETAAMNHYCRPEVAVDGRLLIKDGRHPVVEALSSIPFVSNDAQLDLDQNRTIVLTGPNMAGKSTYMRQVALITLMAQIGSFVPARSAHIGLTDAIYTRVGASDDLAAGQSTFMVEMSEVAHILKNATRNSLVIFDEIGRGTATFDGMSIARAVLEYANDKRRLGCKTLFATHYHELIALEDELDGVKNYNVAVKKHGEDITFLRRILRGGADDSYGIEVAKLAGIPEPVLKRARQVLRQLEAGAPRQANTGKAVPAAKSAPAREAAAAQVSLIDPTAAAILEKLRSIDVNVMTPVQAMNVLFELWKLARPKP